MSNEQLENEIQTLRSMVHTLKGYIWAMAAERGGRIVVSDVNVEKALMPGAALQTTTEEGQTIFCAMQAVQMPSAPAEEGPKIIMPEKKIFLPRSRRNGEQH